MNDHKDDDQGVDDFSLEFPIEVVFYVAISVIFLMIIALMVKLLWNRDHDGNAGGGRGEGRPSESSGLLSSKMEGWFVSYGTSEEEEDIESKGCNSSSDDFYDGKLCVICFDDQRSCLFMPCGHCITCYNCATRIISEEIKSCPICRTYIDKVRRLHIL